MTGAHSHSTQVKKIEVTPTYGRVFPSKTLRNVLAFTQAFAQAYARVNARAKEKGGEVIPESGCGMGVTSIFLPGHPGHLDGVLPGHLDGVLPGHLDEVLPGHSKGSVCKFLPLR